MNSSYLNKKKIKVHKNYKILIKIIKFLLIFIPVNLLKFYKINLIKRRNLPLYFFSLIDEKIKLPLN